MNSSSLLEHVPEDMTATVGGNVAVADLQQTLRRSGQWLPIDPPGAERLTVATLLAHDLSGPRRLGYGTIRDYVIGIKVALADGQVIKSGGKVVKNVAGYDLVKLFIGARHTLGAIVEATFKLRPLPEAECFLDAEVDTFEELHKLSRGLILSAAEPIVLDAHNLAARIRLVTAFAGMREDVDAQVEIASKLGFSKRVTASDSSNSIEYLSRFWTDDASSKVSVLPSKSVEMLKEINPDQFLAHLGNGVIHYRGGTTRPAPAMPHKLMQRVKEQFDPRNLLPSFT
jgi:FAD/FMN-containing dehydrogenase